MVSVYNIYILYILYINTNSVYNKLHYNANTNVQQQQLICVFNFCGKDLHLPSGNVYYLGHMQIFY